MKLKPFLITIAAIILLLWAGYMLVLRGPISPSNNPGPVNATSTETVASSTSSEQVSTYSTVPPKLSFTYPSSLKTTSVPGTVLTACTAAAQNGISSCISYVKEIQLRVSGPITEATYEPVLVSDVTFDPSGMQPKGLSDFKKVAIGGYQFYAIRVGRYEGVLTYNYYLPVDNRVYVFSFTSRGVDWTNPELNEAADPGHLLLRQMLSTIEIEK
jgi:hypothetical protein